MRKNLLNPRSMTTLAAMTLALCASVNAQELTVNNGTQYSNCSPIHTYYWDRANQSQVIYPADQLTELQGKTVTQIKFYVKSAGNLKNDQVSLSVGYNAENYFASTTSFLNTDDFNTVYTGNLSFSSATTVWVLNLTSPFVYAGGNLVLNITNVKGNDLQTYFYGVDTDHITTLYKKSSMASAKFLPKTTFTYTAGDISSASVTPLTLDFGTLLTGEDSETRTVIVKNTGTTAISGSVTLPDDIPFIVSNTTIGTLNPDETTEISVTFDPATDASYDTAMTIDLGDAGTYEVTLRGSSYTMPTGTRTFFNADGYSTALPEGWTPYAEETVVSTGETTDFTTDYSLFPSTYRFESGIVNNTPAIRWDHGNPAPNTDLYERYYFMISPASLGKVWLRATATEPQTVRPFVKAYPATQLSDGSFLLGDEIGISWDNNTLTDSEWSNGTFTVDNGTRIAFFLKYAAIASMVDSHAGPLAITDTEADNTLSGAYTIYDLSGNIVRTGTIGSGDATEGLASGCYIISTADKAVKILKR